jgi:2-polyprenyl-6-methoxyphenol hydroxylase-like FAD-dependent oxidoreductase
VTEVAIAGAGPNGLMVACELGLSGIRPVVLDPMSGPNPEPRVNRIVGQTARLLDHRGLHSVFTGSPDPPKRAVRSIFAGFPLDLASVPGSQLFEVPVQQRGLVQVLCERASKYGTDIRWGHALTGFDQHDGGVTVHVDSPDGAYDLNATYLVGADGGPSTTRRLAGIDFPGMSSYDLVIRMGFDVLPPDELMEPGPLPPQRYHRTEQGVLTCGRVGSRVAVMTYEMDTSAREEPRGDVDEAPMSLPELEASAKRVLGRDVPLRVASPGASPDLRRLSGINSRIASQYRLGRVILVGDSAHVHSPINGPGLNLGLPDAVNLGWKLAAVVNGRVGPALLDTYETERRPAAERVIMQSRVQLALLRPGPEVTALRQLFSELITEPVVVRRLGDLLSGAENRYHAGDDAHPLVGHWVPEFGVKSAGLSPRIAELARDGRPVLADLTESGSVAAAVTDIAGQLTVAAGEPVGEIAATAVLVRPDGHVAWASSQAMPDPDELRELRGVLKHWFGI